jgi:hypothetical protein
VCSMWHEMGSREMRTDNRWRKMKERACLKELARDRNLIVRCILKIECDDMDQILLARNRANGCLLCTL